MKADVRFLDGPTSSTIKDDLSKIALLYRPSASQRPSNSNPAWRNRFSIFSLVTPIPGCGVAVGVATGSVARVGVGTGVLLAIAVADAAPAARRASRVAKRSPCGKGLTCGTRVGLTCGARVGVGAVAAGAPQATASVSKARMGSRAKMARVGIGLVTENPLVALDGGSRHSYLYPTVHPSRGHEWPAATHAGGYLPPPETDSGFKR